MSRQWAKAGIKPKFAIEIDGPPLPLEIEYLWQWFQEISWGIAASGMGTAHLTWAQLAAWSSLTQNRLAAWEAKALLALSVTRAEILSSDRAKPVVGTNVKS